MKNSLPMMKNKMMPVRILAAYSLRLNWEAISEAPRSKKTIKKEIKIMTKALNLASHATMMAVKPLPLAVAVEMVWLTPKRR